MKRGVVPATVIKLFHYEGREEALVFFLQHRLLNDRPHGNAGLISGCRLERSQTVCVRLIVCETLFQHTTAGTRDVNKNAEWVTGRAQPPKRLSPLVTDCGYIPSPSAQSPRHHSSVLWWGTRGTGSQREEVTWQTHDKHTLLFVLGHVTMQTIKTHTRT